MRHIRLLGYSCELIVLFFSKSTENICLRMQGDFADAAIKLFKLLRSPAQF